MQFIIKKDKETKINLTHVLLKTPHITVADAEYLMLIKYIETINSSFVRSLSAHMRFYN